MPLLVEGYKDEPYWILIPLNFFDQTDEDLADMGEESHVAAMIVEWNKSAYPSYMRPSARRDEEAGTVYVSRV